jgi:transposase
VEDWAEIRRLHRAEKVPIKRLARRFGVSRNTVRAALRSEAAPRYVRRPMPSAVDAVEPAIRELLLGLPDMPATVIAERVGWTRGLTILRERVRELRPLYLPPDPAGRTTYRPGELAQWDLWFPKVDIPLGSGRVGRLPVVVGVSGYSRVIVARMIPSKEGHDVLAGHLACLLDLGAVPRVGVYDGEPAIGRWRDGRPCYTRDFEAFRGSSPWAPSSARAPTPAPTASSGAPTATSPRPSSRAARSARPPTSTPSCKRGSPGPTPVPTGPSTVDPSTGSPRTGPPCWPCRRSCPTRLSGRAPGWGATTMCGSSAPTTRQAPEPEVELRDLATYDRLLGLPS